MPTTAAAAGSGSGSGSVGIKITMLIITHENYTTVPLHKKNTIQQQSMITIQ